LAKTTYLTKLNEYRKYEICMAKLITDLTEYWKFDIHLPLQYSTRLNGKYNMLQNTGYLILILHYRNGEDYIAKVRRNIFVLIQQKNNIQIKNVLPTVNPEIDSVPRCFMQKWIT
jgi:hypothetical protein